MHGKKVQHLQSRKNLKSHVANSIQYKIIYIPWYKHTVGMLNPQPTGHTQPIRLCYVGHCNI